jgi:predicted DNA-binding transcriptional regulator AlpA
MQASAETKFLRKRDVAKRYSLHARTIDRLSRAGKLPAPHYPLGQNLPLWSVSELDALDAAKAVTNKSAA